MNWKPMRCSTASAFRTRRRSRSMPRSSRRPPCPLLIPSWSRRCPQRSRTSPMSAASCSMSATTRRCSAADREDPRKRTEAPDRVLVQPMMPGLGEVLIGYRVDRRCRPAGDARGRRRAGRNPPRPQPAAGAGRSRRGPGDDRRGRGAEGARRLSRQAGRAISTRWRRRWWRCRSWRSRTARRCRGRGQSADRPRRRAKASSPSMRW